MKSQFTRNTLMKTRNFSTFNNDLISFDFYLEIDKIMSKEEPALLIKCPCCKSSYCQTGIRYRIVCNIDTSSYFFDKDYPKFLKGITSEEIHQLQNNILRGFLIYPSPMKLYLLPSNNKVYYWQKGYLLTRIKKFKKFNQDNYYNKIVYIKTDKNDLLVLLALGPIIRSILRSKDLLHPNSFLVDNMKDDFYSSVLIWDNVDVLYCIDISLNIPNFSREEVINKLELLSNKNTFLYNQCMAYINSLIIIDNSYIEFGILAFDSIQFSYIINELILDAICWELDKKFAGCRFSRGYTSLFISSIREEDKDKVEKLLSDLSLEGKINLIKEGEDFSNIWDKRIKINKGKIIMMNIDNY